ncbi:Breast cancer suppressor BRCT protein [Rutstroemia sp. NJR-2017a BVV2]|nr:Breast cancer suppressor BRCT protein [Rutstroemia sp. NJR-2017a BVV2]
MDQSPPKRVTRARAAAKSTTDARIKTTRIATAASEAAKVTRTKRKTPSDEEGEMRPARGGRAKKIAIESEPEMKENTAPPKTRGRPKKVAVEAPAPQPTRSLRGRPKKDQETEATEVDAVEEPPKKTTRAHPPTLTRAAGPKKSVKFEEPDKENVVPSTRGKPKAAEVATGLRAKPVRKPAASATASTRSTRARAKPVNEEKVDKPMPLSPKKATQVNSNKGQSSDDELATAVKTPMKPLSKSPVKPPGSIFGTAKKLDISTSTITQTMNLDFQPDHTASTMMSPARRPPQPLERKLDLGTSLGPKPTMEGFQDLGASAMASPARRPPPSSPFKETFKSSPQKLLFGEGMRSAFKPNLFAPELSASHSPFKAPLLQSPARRPASPTKVNEAGSPTRGSHTTSIFDATPKVSTFKISRFATPRTLEKSAIRPGSMLPPSLAKNEVANGTPAPKLIDVQPTPVMEFSGRLSSILPRSADPALSPAIVLPPLETEPVADTPQEQHDEPMVLDEVIDEANVNVSDEGAANVLDEVDALVDTVEVQSTTPTCSPPRNRTGPSFELREEKKLSDEDSESEDELASGSRRYSPAPLEEYRTSTDDMMSSPATPSIFSNTMKTPKTVATQASTRAMRRDSRNKIGFTPLAKQLSQWMSGTHDDSEDNEHDDDAPVSPTRSASKQAAFADVGSAVASPAKSTFFEDEMTIRDELIMAEDQVLESDESDISEPEFNDVEVVAEDLDLALEADEMSMLDPEAFHNQNENEENDLVIENDENAEPTLSQDSQEYGDENEVPIDPALLESAETLKPTEPVYSTPKRVLMERTFHTVSKVPLKEAHETPIRPSPMKRSATVAKMPAMRPSSSLSRSHTAPSLTPVKKTPQTQAFATPVRSDNATVSWSAATPARTPRPDLNTTLLKGAVVFVDVHTTEGADASGLFTELLTQMGAKCVKTWTWNPNTDEDGSKIGITHVVFKDGGKRTLERVRESAGAVSCVGVSWVLDCERENKWLEEAPYVVDTSIIPRGGHRRRKSMEPRALANLNGTLVPSTAPHKSTYSFSSNSSSENSTPQTQKSKRRQSVQWMKSPARDEDKDELGEDAWMLSPVPATPAPEDIRDFVEGQGGWAAETPGAQTPYFFKKEKLVQMTAPGGNKKFVNFDEEGDELAGEKEPEKGMGFGMETAKERDQSVLMRLMAARRKSLQWAPKVGSPLARGGV